MEGSGGKGNEGIAANVKSTANAIGYVEYAKQNNLSYVVLINKDGKDVEPKIETFQEAAKNVDWENTKDYDLIDQKGESTWPITSPTYILMRKEDVEKNPETVRAVLNFFEWSFDNGDKLAKELDYVPLPDVLIKKIKIEWKNALKHEAADH